jgi:glutathione synthase/RimK-type ligase-like ATP-grasp enzyme
MLDLRKKARLKWENETMYIGVDFLFDRTGSLFLSEVNTGVPAGASEFDLAFRMREGAASDVFERIEAVSRETHGKTFREHIQSLPWLDDLRRLKIWMDGQGPFPEDPHPALRLEDKWVQHQLLASQFSVIPTSLWTPKSRERTLRALTKGQRFVLKRRLTRGGKGLRILKAAASRAAIPSPNEELIVQPYIESRISKYALSVRAAAFSGRFLCMFASLANRSTSNHGIRFLVSQGESIKLNPPDFKTRDIVQKSWEADIFYRGRIPNYLYHNVYEEQIAEAELFLPEAHIDRIKQAAAEISRLYGQLDFSTLQPSWIETGA